MKQWIVDDFSGFFKNPNEKNICKSKKTGMTLIKHKRYSFTINSFVQQTELNPAVVPNLGNFRG